MLKALEVRFCRPYGTNNVIRRLMNLQICTISSCFHQRLPVFIMDAITFLLLSSVLCYGASSAVPTKPPFLWPLPQHYTSSDGDLTVHHNFNIDYQLVGENPVINSGSGVLNSATKRYADIIFFHEAHQAINPNAANVLSRLLIEVHSLSESLGYGTDESYSLHVPDPQNATQAYLQANTVYGALRGLETFSQLCLYNFSSQSVEIHNTPWSITDQPRFAYRGLLLDTARHYQPLAAIFRVIDAMSYAKLNVLHWHIVDTQSFPLEIPSFPKLWQGSFSSAERYTIEDAQAIVSYARMRGVNVMPELDVPGHAQSWGTGYPQLWPSINCTQPLDISQNFTFEVIHGIISDFSKVFHFDFVHMGGDEVNTSCWRSVPHVQEWLKQRNMTESDGYKEFVLKGEEISVKSGYTPINWEEAFNNFGSELNRETIIQNWLGPGVAPRVVKEGFRCIVSNQDAWYLDHLNVPWSTFYMNEPLTNITDPNQQKLVLGGEVCMWGERVDDSNIEQTIWPRAAAAAERLWSSLDVLGGQENPLEDALLRLHHFRCLLNLRGIEAAPVEGQGRDAPDGPGSCFAQ